MKVLDLLSLKGKTALITGGSRGLGLQMAEALGEMGAQVAISARKQDELEEAISHLKKMNIQGMSFVCDIGKREQIFKAFQNTTQYRVLLAHPGCVHHGQTLTSATTTIST